MLPSNQPASATTPCASSDGWDLSNTSSLLYLGYPRGHENPAVFGWLRV